MTARALKPEIRFYISIGSAILLLVALVALTIVLPPGAGVLLPVAIFALLLLLTMTFGVVLSEGEVSLLPMTSVAACLVVGPIAGAWAAFAAAVAYGLLRYARPDLGGLAARPQVKALIGLTSANAAMHATSLLVSGLVYGALGGSLPLLEVTWPGLGPLLVLGLVYLVVNYVVAAVYIAARGRASLLAYGRSLPRLVFYEGSPLFFAPLMALIYTRLGIEAFFLFALILVAASLITRHLAFTSRRLARRVSELDSLRAVGQALSASLDVGTILDAIYDQVIKLMPARSFYVALYEPETDEVSFPLAIEQGERVEWRPRRAGNGLTEHVLRTRAPLLISHNFEATMEALGLDSIGQPARCWLGVPLLAGPEPLGVIALQSVVDAEAYDVSHQEILVTIAAQAAVAIENARLYGRTDQALTRRVQELDSILRATRDGIMLLDTDLQVLTANRALANLLGVVEAELPGKGLIEPWPGEAGSLAAMTGYTAAGLAAECEALRQGPETTCEQTVALDGPDQRHVERALTPVYDRAGDISGWLITLRDVTEEIEHARHREDLMHMLVHDLRSPLTVIKGSLDLIGLMHAEGNEAKFQMLLDMAQRNDDHLLRVVGDLLDISRLEDGQQPVRPEPFDVAELLAEIVSRMAPLFPSAQLAIDVSVEPGLPLLCADRHLLDRVVGNLLNNAIKFTPDGGTIRVWARPDPEVPAGGVLVGVTDSGPGIPAEEQPRLFQKFHRVDNVHGRWTGTGLGLSFCQLAVEAHGGRIWVESQLGQGSTFVVALPPAADGMQPEA